MTLLTRTRTPDGPTLAKLKAHGNRFVQHLARIYADMPLTRGQADAACRYLHGFRPRLKCPTRTAYDTTFSALIN